MSDAQREASTLHDYLRVVRRRKWIIIQAAVLVPLAAILFSLQQRHLYQATAEVLLSNQNLAAALTDTQLQQGISQPDRIAQTQADLARVPTVAKRVLRSLGLSDRTPDRFLGESSVSPKTNADLLQFTVTDPNRLLASRLASEYARQFRIYRHELDTGALKSARKEVQARIAQLESEGDKDSALYPSLVEKDQQLGTLEALQTSNAYVVRAAGSAAQVQPKPVRNAILGLLLGLVLGIGLAFLWEALDTRIRSADEIGDRLGLPLLARLPAPSKQLRAQSRLTMLDEPSSASAEAFRMMRTNLEFTNLDRGARTIMVTSAVEGEGKSTTVANLAVALARAGKRVLLVDLDLRRPFLHRFFNVGPRAGITDVALGRAELVEAIVPIAIGGDPASPTSSNGHAAVHGVLEVVLAGTQPPDPGEFLSTQALAEILARLRKRAEIVLIDAPPLLHVGDGMTLSARVDALLLVTRLQMLRRGTLAELDRVLQTSPAAIVGYAVTGAQLEDRYGYAYGAYEYRTRPAAGAPREPVS